MDRLGESFSADVKRNGLALPNLLQTLNPVAGKTDFLGNSLRLHKGWKKKKSNNRNQGAQQTLSRLHQHRSIYLKCIFSVQ
jgi:hypothetical protein